MPLVENSFKHGRHKLENDASVKAALLIEQDKLVFKIENDMLDAAGLPIKNHRGGIGLSNIKKRLELYYTEKYELKLQENNNKYIAELIIEL